MTGARTPASAEEEVHWLTERFIPGSRAAVVPWRFRLEGPVDTDALGVAVNAVRQRHPVLRTGFRGDEGRLWRYVEQSPDWPGIVPLPAGTDSHGAIETLCSQRFDLATADVLRVGMAPAADGAEVHLAIHHIAVDGYSEGLFAAELADAYGQVLAGLLPRWDERPRASASDPTDSRRAELTAYWREALDGVADLPSGDRALSYVEVFRDRVVELAFSVSPDTALRLRQRVRAESISVFAMMLTAVGRAIARLTGSADFCLGTPVSTRQPDQDGELCCAMNVVPIRLRDPFGPAATTRAWRTILGAVEHADLPQPEIIGCGPVTDGPRMPVYQALLSYQNWSRAALEAGPAWLRTLPVGTCGPLAELMVEVYDVMSDDITGVAQAPAAGFWAGRLADFVSSLLKELTLLVEGTQL